MAARTLGGVKAAPLLLRVPSGRPGGAGPALTPPCPRVGVFLLVSSFEGALGWRVGGSLAAVGIGDVEDTVRFQLGYESRSGVEGAVVSSTQQGEVVQPGLAVVGHPLHMVAFTPGGR